MAGCFVSPVFGLPALLSPEELPGDEALPEPEVLPAEEEPEPSAELDERDSPLKALPAAVSPEFPAEADFAEDLEEAPEALPLPLSVT